MMPLLDYIEHLKMTLGHGRGSALGRVMAHVMPQYMMVASVWLLLMQPCDHKRMAINGPQSLSQTSKS